MSPLDSLEVPSSTLGQPTHPTRNVRPSRADAERAIETVIAYLGDDPEREGLVDTPARVMRAYDEFFVGYSEDPADHLARTFEEVESYGDLIVLKDIPFESHCEHHMVPFNGLAHVAYLPHERVVGISKLARVVDGYAKRLQVQEKLTNQIGHCIQDTLQPLATAVFLEGEHECMRRRGVRKRGATMTTSCFLGRFKDDQALQDRFLRQIGY